MQIELVKDTWRIETDEMNVILKRKAIRGDKAKEPGEDFWITVGYYGNIDWALRAAVDKGILRSDDETLVELLDTLNKIYTTIHERLGTR